LCFCAAALIEFDTPLKLLTSLAFNDARYTSILPIPFISIGLLWLNRRTIFGNVRYAPTTGLILVLAGLIVSVDISSRLNSAYSLSISVFGVLVAWVGAFVWCYGTQAARDAVFPMFFLLLMIPIPANVLDNVVRFLQRGSADMTAVLFQLTGVPAIREGAFQFVLPGVTIEVAEECSGIRSTLSLFVSSILAAYVFLRSHCFRFLFVLLAIPIGIFRNAVRILTISWLGFYVDSGFFVGRLHRYGGLVFFVVALVPMMLALLMLTNNERVTKRTAIRENNRTRANNLQ
jgi:exosortase